MVCRGVQMAAGGAVTRDFVFACGLSNISQKLFLE